MGGKPQYSQALVVAIYSSLLALLPPPPPYLLSRPAPLSSHPPHPPSVNLPLPRAPRRNPAFHSWNLVVMLYCDGGGYMSIRGPVLVRVGPGKQRMIHMQGWNNVQAVMHDIKLNRGANAATRVLLSGCSAGGQAVIMLCDRMAAAFPAAATKCLSDSAFITDAKDRLGERHARQYVKEVATTHNINIPNCYTGAVPSLLNSRMHNEH
ncbi:unnamed protein product [Closterium sp. NIES-53]